MRVASVVLAVGTVLLLGAFWASVRRDGAAVKWAAYGITLVPGLAGAVIATLIVRSGPMYFLAVYDTAMLLFFAASLGHPAYGPPEETLKRPPRQPSPHPAYYARVFASQQRPEAATPAE